MGQHPNTFLVAVFTPEKPRAFARSIVRDTPGRYISSEQLAALAEPIDEGEVDPEVGDDYEDEDEDEGLTVHIGSDDYTVKVARGELEYDNIPADEDDVIVYGYVTYGYGEAVSWEELVQEHDLVVAWAEGVREKYKVDFHINIGANYW